MKCYYFEDVEYKPIQPQADNEELAKKGERLILLHTDEGPKLFIAPMEVIHSGWVVGLI